MTVLFVFLSGGISVAAAGRIYVAIFEGLFSLWEYVGSAEAEREATANPASNTTVVRTHVLATMIVVVRFGDLDTSAFLIAVATFF